MALKSMTAFGSGEEATDTFNYVCEVKSLNSRFIEVNARLPRFLAMLEPEIVQFVKSHCDRGKIDLYFDIKSKNLAATLPKVNDEAVQHYLECAQKIKDLIGDASDHTPLSVGSYIRLEGVLDSETTHTSSKEQAAVHKAPLLKAIEKALIELKQNRKREGDTLSSSILQHIEALRAEYEQVKTMAPDIRNKLEDNYFKKIEATKTKLAEKGQINESDLSAERITAELVLAADKIDVAEELDRLVSHIDEFESQLAKGEKVGRRLDFICQEMHREVNTLSNKLVNAEISKLSVSMKQNVERIKQQVQNIE